MKRLKWKKISASRYFLEYFSLPFAQWIVVEVSKKRGRGWGFSICPCPQAQFQHDRNFDKLEECQKYVLEIILKEIDFYSKKALHEFAFLHPEKELIS